VEIPVEAALAAAIPAAAEQAAAGNSLARSHASFQINFTEHSQNVLSLKGFTMKKFLIGCGVVAVVLLVVAISVVGWAISANNRFVTLQEQMKSSWSQVEVVLQRRYDLIPNYVNTVKGYAKHEKETLEDVTKYRSQWAAAKTPEEKIKAANLLEGSLAKVSVVVERYPDLKASQNFHDLQYELAGTENRISVERQRYNDSVRAYNTAVRQFPGSIIAGMKGFAVSNAYFESAASAKEAPKVQF
jgi:LemA protein